MPVSLSHRLIFLRHGETDWNAEGRLQGQQDIPLNARGREQAAAAGHAVRHFLGPEADTLLARLHFVASPLLRTRDTMQRARIAMALPPEPFALDARLMELTFGLWETHTWAEIKATQPTEARARTRDKWDFTPPEGESYAQLSARVRLWIDDVAGDTLVVAHGGTARVLLHLLGDMSPPVAANAVIHQGRPLIFEHGSYYWL